jgi:hypothetical protein
MLLNARNAGLLRLPTRIRCAFVFHAHCETLQPVMLQLKRPSIAGRLRTKKAAPTIGAAFYSINPLKRLAGQRLQQPLRFLLLRERPLGHDLFEDVPRTLRVTHVHIGAREVELRADFAHGHRLEIRQGKVF